MGNGYPGAIATGYREPGGQAGISSRRFVAASVPDLKRLETSVELLSVPLDVQVRRAPWVW